MIERFALAMLDIKRSLSFYMETAKGLGHPSTAEEAKVDVRRLLSFQTFARTCTPHDMLCGRRGIRACGRGKSCPKKTDNLYSLVFGHK